MKLTAWDPFRDLDDLFARYSPFYRAGVMRPAGGADKEIEWSPAADINETETEYVVKADLPGVDKKDVQITLENGQLRIFGERKIEKQESGENQVRVERFHGAFARTFSLPDDADTAGVKASSTNGCLTIRIPRKKAARPARIEVPVG